MAARRWWMSSHLCRIYSSAAAFNARNQWKEISVSTRKKCVCTWWWKRDDRIPGRIVPNFQESLFWSKLFIRRKLTGALEQTNFLLIIHNDVTCWNTGNWNIDLKGGCYQVFAEVSTMVANQLSQWLFEGHPRCVSPRGGRIQSFHWNVFKGLDKYATDASHVSDEMWWQECLLGFDLYRPIVPLACAASTRSMQIGCHTSCSMNWKQKILLFNSRSGCCLATHFPQSNIVQRHVPASNRWRNTASLLVAAICVGCVLSKRAPGFVIGKRLIGTTGQAHKSRPIYFTIQSTAQQLPATQP